MKVLSNIFLVSVLLMETLQLDRNSMNRVKVGMKSRLPVGSPLRDLVEDDLYAVSWLESRRALKKLQNQKYKLPLLQISFWFAVNSQNVQLAIKAFESHLTWREMNQIDTIHLEDWSSYVEEYPGFSDTFDKTGRPTVEVWISDWNVRKAWISGRARQLTRWYAYLLEKTQSRLYATRRSGVNVTGAVGIFDLEGFNVFRQGCPVCLTLFANIANIYVTHYHRLYEKVLLLNAGSGPQGFIAASKLFGPLTRNMMVYPSEDIWRKHLDNQFTRGNRSTRFGGNIKRGY